ncbi:FliM/FliN family flagellar motor switch protein [Sphingosinicella sp. LHD-64]|uniref:flagellar motor switch protein FliM n=1 Tax=Sphingosinicella sp. LHD-64 TaxID=3072139 RepID=UPI00280EA0D4|nr:FliM/FliN family flagellar motor switch protein [Sphingosinicella sp. LHD-64]MDQ8757161.1 FliM/FliN family flagellar motor switch protein [Sphingosinicella sp. LHD-64]
MTDQPTLSGEEISALMSGAQGEPDGAGSSGAARPFPFGGDAGRPMAVLPAVDRLNERMVRRVRDLIEPFARAKPNVTVEPTVVRSFGDWQAEQGEFASLSLYSFKPMKGAILIRIEPEFVSRLVDAYYGGTGALPTRRAREFTATEESVASRLADTLAAALGQVWSEVVPAQPLLRSRETHAGFAGLAKAEEAIAVSQFTIAPWPGQGATIEILYPVAGLRSLEHLLAAKPSDDVGLTGSDWRRRMGTAVGEVRIKARTVLARPELPLSELMQLRPGDVIPVSLPTHVPLLVEGRRFAIGTIGEHDGRAALKIEKIEQRRFVS